jgi:hypothetical protein
MALQRLRVGPVHGPTMLGVLAAALLIAALVITGRSQNLAGGRPAPSVSSTAAAQAPYRVSGGYRCPLGRPVLALADGHSYPPGHPTRPPQDARATACYQTLAEAAAAGYRPAPLPSGALEIGGVYLAPTDRAFRSRCQLAADRLGFAVPCPGLLPTSAPGTAPPKLCRTQVPCRRGQGLVFQQEGFVVPPGYFGVDKQSQGSLELTASRTRQSTGVVDLGCGTEQPIGTVRVQGSRAVLAGCHGWSSSGQVTLIWKRAGVDISMTLQGASAVNQQLLIALATHVHLVRPST